MEMTTLFSEIPFNVYSQSLFDEVKKALTNISNKDFEKRSEKDLSDDVFKEYELEMPELDESKIFQKEPEDIGGINTKFEFVIPIKKGTKTLLTVLPTNHSTTKPEGGLQSDGVHCLYIKTHNFPAANINTEFRNNVHQLKEYLEWLKADVNE